MVWETFKEASEVFQTNALPPTAWTATRTLPAAFGATQKRGNLKATSRFGLKGLYGTSKFAGGPALDLTEFSEAAPNGAWLTAQALMKNHLTLFEKRMNEDEFNYVVSNRLYNAANQAPFALTNGINLPDGSAAFLSYGTVGAIEIKGAWIELDDPTLWPLFKISQAYVSYPTTNGMTVPRLATVGLVALHIIRKTPNAQQFVWSTFEHVNNSPSTSDLQNQTLKAWYTYYSANCVTNSDYYGCQWNRAPSPGTDPYDAPVQVVRTTADQHINRKQHRAVEFERLEDHRRRQLELGLPQLSVGERSMAEREHIDWPRSDSPVDHRQRPTPGGSAAGGKQRARDLHAEP